MMRCVQCGRDYPERQAFCHQCGEPLRPREAPVEAPVPRPRAQATLGRSRAIVQTPGASALPVPAVRGPRAAGRRHGPGPGVAARVDAVASARHPEPAAPAGSATDKRRQCLPGSGGCAGGDPAGGTGTGAASSRRTRPRAGRDDASPAGGNAGSRTGPGGPRLAAREASPRPGPPRRKPAGAASVGPSAGRRPISTAARDRAEAAQRADGSRHLPAHGGIARDRARTRRPGHRSARADRVGAHRGRHARRLGPSPAPGRSDLPAVARQHRPGEPRLGRVARGGFAGGGHAPGRPAPGDVGPRHLRRHDGAPGGRA